MKDLQIEILANLATLLDQGKGKEASDLISENEYDLFGQSEFSFHWIGEILVMRTPEWEGVMDMNDNVLAFEG